MTTSQTIAAVAPLIGSKWGYQDEYAWILKPRAEAADDDPPEYDCYDCKDSGECSMCHGTTGYPAASCTACGGSGRCPFCSTTTN